MEMSLMVKWNSCLKIHSWETVYQFYYAFVLLSFPGTAQTSGSRRIALQNAARGPQEKPGEQPEAAWNFIW